MPAAAAVPRSSVRGTAGRAKRAATAGRQTLCALLAVRQKLALKLADTATGAHLVGPADPPAAGASGLVQSLGVHGVRRRVASWLIRPRKKKKRLTKQERRRLKKAAKQRAKARGRSKY